MNLITDRTRQDVTLQTPKGQYGLEDLNRVEKAVAELVKMARALDVHCPLQIKTDWGRPGEFVPEQWPTRQQMDRYLHNIYRLCEAVEVKAGLPVTMEKLTWQGANQIEQALMLVHTRIVAVLQAFRYSGEFFAGEENIL